MNTEDTRTVIAEIIHLEYTKEADEGNACLDCGRAGKKADKILAYLASLAESELPENPHEHDDDAHNQDATYETDCLACAEEAQLKVKELKEELRIRNHLYAELTDKFNDADYKVKEQARRIEGLLSFGEDVLNMIRHGDYSNGVTANEGTVDQGRVQARETLGFLEKNWRELSENGI